MSNGEEILFFHGLESKPMGTKSIRLSEHFRVKAPDFQGMDIWERLEKAEELTEDMSELVVVGSSYGGLLTALLFSRHPERFRNYVLMAPALYLDAAEEIERMPDDAVVIHGTHDDVVPIESVRSFCEFYGLEIEEVDDDHRLHGSLDNMVAGVRRIFDTAPR